MGPELGKAYVQVMPSAKGIKGMLESQMGGEASGAGISVGGILGSSLVKAVGGVITAAGIGKMIGASISEGAALEQSIGGIETLFKDSADTVIKYANDAYKTAGLSANEYMEQTTSFAASLLQSTGGNAAEAAEISNMAMIDMADNANKMGTNMQDIQNAYQGFAKQNYTMLDNLKLGYGGTKTEMERLLADAQELTGVEYNIDNLADVYEAIHVIQEELDITGTTAKEAAETFSGSFAAMKAAATNVLGKLALGEDIKPALKGLAETTATFLFGNFFPMIGNILSGLPELIGTFITEAIPYFIEGGKGMIDSISQGFSSGLPQIGTTVTEMFTGFTTWITENLPSLLDSGVQMLTNIVNGILQALPSLITMASQLISQFAIFLYTNFPVILQAGADLIMNLVDGIITNFPSIATSAMGAFFSFVDTIITHAPGAITAGIEIIVKLVSGIIQKLPEIISTAIEIMEQFVGKIIERLPAVLDAGKEIIQSLIDGVKQLIGSVIDTFTELGSDIVDKVSNINLISAGKAIMDSLLSGLKDAWGGVKDFVGGIGTWIQDNKGPIEYDRKLLIPAGRAIMEGLERGLREQFGDVKSEVLSVADMIASVFENMDTGPDSLNKTISIDAVVEDTEWNSIKPINESLVMRTGSYYDMSFKKEDNDILEALFTVVDRLEKINNKEFATYLDGREVSVGLRHHLDNINRITKSRQLKIEGERYV